MKTTSCWLEPKFRKAGMFRVMVSVLFLFLAITSSQASSPATNKGFLENSGQISDDQGNPLPSVLFTAEFPASKVYVTEWGLSYFFIRPDSSLQPDLLALSRNRGAIVPPIQVSVQWQRIDLVLTGAAIRKEKIRKSGESAEFSNYYFPHCPSGIAGVHSFSGLILEDIYPGIDWELNFSEAADGFKQNFIVHPGADYRNIILQYYGPADLVLECGVSNLKATCGMGVVDEGDLIGISADKAVKMKYETSGLNQFRFVLMEEFPSSQSLIIDPNVLVWGTYYGGGGFDYGNSIWSDGSGVWASGYSGSVNLPCLNPGGGAYYQGSSALGFDLYILKFNGNGVRQFATYYGGSGNDFANAIHSNGTSVWVCGQTQSSDFPVQNPGGGAYYQATLNAGDDAFLLKFNTSGLRQWATFYGGDGEENASGIFSTATQVWVTGNTTSSDFPCQNPGGGAYYQSGFAGVQDAFVLRFSVAGIRQHATYYGGDDIDESHSIHVSGSNVFFAGYSGSGDFPLQNPGGGAWFQNTPDGIDIFLVKMSSAGVRQWSTFYGGNDDEMLNSVYCDGTFLWCTGYAVSTDFPLLNPGSGAYYQSSLAGADQTAILLKFTIAGVRQWATFYGGDVNSEGNSIFSDGSSVWVAGSSESSDFPTLDPGSPAFYQGHNSDLPSIISESWDAFILEFSMAGIRQWATYYGAEEDDFGNSIHYDGTYLWVAGTAGSSFGLTLVNPGSGAYFQSTCGCGAGIPNMTEGLILKFGVPGTLNGENFTLHANSGVGEILLDWDLIPASTFVIEKSLDGNNFSQLASLTASPNMQWSDHYPSPGVQFYRVIALDESGLHRYSNVVALAFENEEPGCFVYQDAGRSLNILKCPGGAGIPYRLVSAEGKLILEAVTQEEETPINLGNHVNGLYFLQTMQENQVRVLRLLK